MDTIKLTVIPDDSCKDLEGFSITSTIKFAKTEIFTFGILNIDVPPDRIGENDFEYLQSKIPSYMGMYEDYIVLDKIHNRIIGNATGETLRQVSEIIGVGVGLKVFTYISKFERKTISKIGVSKHRVKRLDFRANNGKVEYEIETKGTAYKNNVKGMIDDVHNKKTGKDKTVRRIGFVTEIRKADEEETTIVHSTDPDGDVSIPEKRGIYKNIQYYLLILSYILDNPDYNSVVRKYEKEINYRKPIINKDKIHYRYIYNKRVYIGQCFDRRLILNKINYYKQESRTIDQLFKFLTDDQGKEKYFLGLDEKIIDMINVKDTKNVSMYTCDDYLFEDQNTLIAQMSDGTLFLKSKNGALPEIERIFPEDDVKKRLGEYFNYLGNERHECGASCRSREKEGKSCEILTFRENCHFHR
jgi:hypothetical protein